MKSGFPLLGFSKVKCLLVVSDDIDEYSSTERFSKTAGMVVPVVFPMKIHLEDFSRNALAMCSNGGNTGVKRGKYLENYCILNQNFAFPLACTMTLKGVPCGEVGLMRGSNHIYMYCRARTLRSQADTGWASGRAWGGD